MILPRKDNSSPLAELGARLAAYGFTVDLTARGLKVTNPQFAGCCDQVANACDTITCRPRQEDGGVVWFWNSCGEPIATTDRVSDAALVIRVRLGGRHTVAGGER